MASLSKLRRRQMFSNYLFVAPAVLGVLIFQLGPMIVSLYLSFTRYDIVRPARWIGLTNYVRIFTEDDLFYRALLNTAYYSGLTLPLRLIIALIAAVLLNSKLRGMGFFRSLYYLPTISAGVAVSLLWKLIYEPRYGLVNNLLAMLGIQGPRWLGDPRWAMPAIILMMSLNIGQFMLIFLGGLQSIPLELYEAAEIDGGTSYAKFRWVTVPLLTPVIFFNLVVGMIQTFQVFTQAYVMTGGGPLNATLVYVLYLYERAFRSLQMGYASAMAWILFAIILCFTILQFRISDRWVYYRSSGGAVR
ncbi:MAG: carbohydrate ABC transporter permease [Limnochordia bacterium]